MLQEQFYFPTSKTEAKKMAGKYLTPFQRKNLEKTLQKEELSDKQRQRIQIMLLADEGKTQVKICHQLGCSQATARHWIMMARTNQAHNWDSTPIGRPSTINQQYLERLQQLVRLSPQSVTVPNRNYNYPFKRWTAQKLSQHLQAELDIEVTPQHINRLLRKMGLSTRNKSKSPSNHNHRSSWSGEVSSKRSIEIRNLNPIML